MKILITGNLGYVGSVLVKYLKFNQSDIELIGFDNAYFSDKIISNFAKPPEIYLYNQYFGDMRDFPEEILKNVDVVVHLAAISNDPMGNKFEKVTNEINYISGIRLAKLATKYNVRNFVFASSCSIYGSASALPKSESDSVNPLTEYAKSKINLENELEKLKTEMNITCLRFSTACGMSDRLRVDLVLNDFVLSALTYNKIEILSDGTPWRPLIDVNDMSRAIHWAINRSADNGGKFLKINIGHKDWNYQVLEIAKKVSNLIPGVEICINKNALPDKRSYKVDFDLFRNLAPDFQPIMKIEDSINNLINGIKNSNYSFIQIKDSEYFIRLKTLNKHIENGNLNNHLNWI